MGGGPGHPSNTGYDGFDFNNPPPAPPGNPLLTEDETNKMNDTLAHMASSNYGGSLGEGFIPGEWEPLSMTPLQMVSMSTRFGKKPTFENEYLNHLNGLFQTDTSSLFPPVDMPPSSLPMESTAPQSLVHHSPTTAGPHDLAMQSAFHFPPPPPPPPPHPHAHAHAQLSPPASMSMMNPTDPVFAHPNGMPHDPRQSPPMQQHPPDVIQAAQALQGGHYHHRAQSMHNIPIQHRQNNQGRGPPVGHLRYQDLNDFHQEHRRIIEALEAPNTEMFVPWFDPPKDSRPQRALAPTTTYLDYGSDSRFNGNHPYKPQNDKESFEGLTQEQDRYLSAVKLSESAGPTRQPSPDFVGLQLRTKGPSDSLSIRRRSLVATDMGARKLSLDEVEPQSATTTKSTGGRKRKTTINNLRASTGSPSADGIDNDDGRKKRRKSAAAGGATKKANLTEDQKRENHIKSERKRRGVIDVGFKNLNKMVPVLRDQSPSKATTLTSAHDFYVETMIGNQELKDMLGEQ
ncbi:unnamed protein product [Discula destructiva]